MRPVLLLILLQLSSAYCTALHLPAVFDISHSKLNATINIYMDTVRAIQFQPGNYRNDTDTSQSCSDKQQKQSLSTATTWIYITELCTASSDHGPS